MLDLKTLTWLFFGEKPTINHPDPRLFIAQPAVDATLERDAQHNLLRFKWTPQAETVHLHWSRTADLTDKQPLARVMGSTEAEISPPDAEGRLYYELCFSGGAADGQRLVVAERILTLERGINFRDIGGYRTEDGRYVRWGKVYRSGLLSDLTAADHAQIAALGLGMICDLRTAGEIADAPDQAFAGMLYRHLPVYGGQEAAHELQRMIKNLGQLETVLFESYTQMMIDRKASVFADFMRLLAQDAHLPLVVHCTAGKDRTGISIALLLSILGVPEAVIVDDYTLTNFYIDHYRTGLLPRVKRLKRFNITVDTFTPMLSANPRVIRDTLQHVQSRYGSAERYLQEAGGLTAETIMRLRERLLEPR